jgi:hypothetical protein
MSDTDSITLGEDDTVFSEEETVSEEETISDLESDDEEEDEYELAWADIRRENEWRQFYGKRGNVEDVIYNGEHDDDATLVEEEDSIVIAKRRRLV